MFFWNSIVLDDPTDISNLIPSSSDFSKSKLNIWKFSVLYTQSGSSSLNEPLKHSLCDNECLLSHLGTANSFANMWTLARQAPLSMGFPRQEYWSGLPSPSPGHLPDPGIKPSSPVSLLADRFFTTEPSGKPRCNHL